MARTRVGRAASCVLWLSAAHVLASTDATAQQGRGESAASSRVQAEQPATASRARAPVAATHEEKPTARAVRINSQIDIDGRLDESVWTTAPPVTEFWQVQPDEGARVSEPTEVRFLYDDEAIYVGAWLYDNDGQIVTRLSRRDTGIPDVDLFAVHFDSYHSHRSSNRFTVTALGTIRDLAMGAGATLTRGDVSWNPVWDVRTTITDEGWFAEMRIPFSQLRFSREEDQVWGLQIERKIRPHLEETVWAFTPTTEPPGQHNFGHLVGIRGIKPGRKLELLPYIGGRAEYVAVPQNSNIGFENPFRSGSDYFGNAGLDLKYGLTSNLTLDGSVNPDFGQVEVDPAVINLTAFETRFAERRPFFVEGAEIFDFGENAPQLLYSRRIGRAPHGSAPSEAIYDLTPRSTTILGAAKLTGKTANGWSLALLDAVTGREMASWRSESNVASEIEVEPLTNYLAGRARKEMRGGLTTIGGIFTAVHRVLSGSPLAESLHSTAYTGGLDFSHDFADRAWHLNASVSPSYVKGNSDALVTTQRASRRYYQRPDADHIEIDSTATSLLGYSVQAAITKQSGLWRFHAFASAISPGFEVNDLGFSTNADRISANFALGYEQTRPGPRFQSWNVRAAPALAWNYGADLIDASVELSGRVQFRNFSSLSTRVGYNPSTLNPRLTRGGALARDPSGYSASLSFNTANQGRVSLRSGVSWGADRSGAWERRVNVGANFRVGEYFEAQVRPEFAQSRSTAQYITSVPDPTATRTFGRRYVFADLDQTTLSMDLRFNITISPRVTMEVFAQPLLSSGNYGVLKELGTPRTFNFNRFGTDVGTIAPLEEGTSYDIDPDGIGPGRTFTVGNRDFNVRSLRSNAVFRWEWRPGSTLFLVWQQTRSGRLAGSGPDSSYRRVGNFDLARDVGDLFGLDSDDIFMVKLSYWLNP